MINYPPNTYIFIKDPIVNVDSLWSLNGRKAPFRLKFDGTFWHFNPDYFRFAPDLLDDDGDARIFVRKIINVMRNTHLLLLLLLVSQMVSAQTADSAYHRLGLAIGAQQTHILDQQFSPLTYSADELTSTLFYEGKQKSSNWQTSLGFSTGALYPQQFANRQVYNSEEDIEGNITTDSSLVRGTTRTFIFEAGYAYDIIRHEHLQINAGACVRNQLMYPETFVNLGILNAASLMLTTRATWQLGAKNRLRLDAAIPVVGFNTRFPYSGTVSRPNQTLLEAFFDGGTKFVSFGQYLQIQFGADFRTVLSPRIAAGLRYGFMWQQYRHTELMRSYAGNLSIVFDYSF